MPKAKSSFSHVTWLRQREISHNFPLGTRDNFHTRLYSSIYAVGSWDHHENLRNAVHGGVFNLEFSPDGKLLVAACEKKSILMFDPLSQRMINGIDDAHTECVNCVRFLDSRVFATCSDDTTVALWDARNLKQRIHTLRGHKNWVKNIEFSAKDGLLVTSGFDGSIYTWDINNYSEKRVFHTNGLMRTRLNPDASKMIICTTGGYLMIIHDLDLANLATDLAGFKPNMYRLMQQNQAIYPGGVDFSYLFSKRQKRNRVEFITDFPKGVDAEVISSLQVHPQGWCALSRNVNNDESSEWTCVHDIQERPDDGSSETEEDDTDSDRDSSPSPPSFLQRRATRILPTSREGEEEDSRRIRRVGEIVRSGSTYTANVELHVSSSDVWEAIVAVREARMSRQRERDAPNPAPQDGRANRFAILVNRQLEEEGITERSRNNMAGDDRDPIAIFREIATARRNSAMARQVRSGASTARSETSQTASRSSTARSQTSQPASRTSTAHSETSLPASRTSTARSETSQATSQTSQAASQTSTALSETSQPASWTSTALSETSQPTSGTSAARSQSSEGAPVASSVRSAASQHRLRNNTTHSQSRVPFGQASPTERRRLRNTFRSVRQLQPVQVSRPEYVHPTFNSLPSHSPPAAPGSGVSPTVTPGSTVNYEALADALRRTEEFRVSRAARLFHAHNIDINEQMPILHGLAATMVQTLAAATSATVGGRLDTTDTRDLTSTPPIYNTNRDTQFNWDTPETVRDAGVNTISVPAGEGSSVDISITTRSRGRFNRYNAVSHSDVSQRTIPFSRPTETATSSSSYMPETSRFKIHRNYKVHQNVPRLLNYIEEPNVGKGFIKELCFSSDGRLICSPFAFGVRLLAFTPNCSELSTSVPLVPTQLYELKTNICHGNTVVSTKFSPQHCLLVSGCLNGKIVWHQPNVW